MEPKSKLFSSREVRALLLLLPVLAVVSWLVWAVARPKIDESAAAADATGVTTNSGQHGANFGQGGADVALSEDQGSGDSTNGTAPPTERESTAGAPTSPKLFAFDPNTIDYHDLVRLGFTRGEALGIVKYRARGKVFEIPEDFAACYQVSEAMYLRLAPYIVIGEQYRLKPFAQRGSGSEGSSTTSVSRQSGSAPADVANIAPPTERESAAAAPLSRETRLENHNAIVELNSADSAALVSVRGIGAVTVGRIMEHRARLGGFVRAEQLAEVRGVTEQNYELILPQIFVDTLAIQKIDINFAPARILAVHPYIGAEALRKLLKQRQLKGGWRNTGELVEDKIFTPADAEKLHPYLLFRPFSAPQ